MDLALNNIQWLICHKTKPLLCTQVYTVYIVSVYWTVYQNCVMLPPNIKYIHLFFFWWEVGGCGALFSAFVAWSHFQPLLICTDTDFCIVILTIFFSQLV